MFSDTFSDFFSAAKQAIGNEDAKIIFVRKCKVEGKHDKGDSKILVCKTINDLKKATLKIFFFNKAHSICFLLFLVFFSKLE